MQSDRTKVYSIRLPNDVRQELEHQAQANCRSLSQEIVYLLMKALKEA